MIIIQAEAVAAAAEVPYILLPAEEAMAAVAEVFKTENEI
jgi:hypothetical protein